MKTNNFFDPVRFFGLLKQDLLFNYKFYLWFLIGLSIGIYLVSYLSIRTIPVDKHYLSVYYFLYSSMLTAMIIFVGMSFPAFRNHVNSSNYLLTPGSAFEKILIQFVIRFVLFIPLMLVLLRVCIFLAVATMVPDPKVGFDPLFVDDFSYRALFSSSEALKINPSRDLAYMFASFAGSAYFRRYAVVKTQLVLTLFTLALLLSFLLTGERDWFKLGTDFLGGAGFYFALSPVAIGFFLLSLPWAYYTMKEKEL